MGSALALREDGEVPGSKSESIREMRTCCNCSPGWRLSTTILVSFFKPLYSIAFPCNLLGSNVSLGKSQPARAALPDFHQ